MSRARSSGVQQVRAVAAGTLLALVIVAAFVGPAAAAAPLPTVFADDEVGPEPPAGQPGFLDFTLRVRGAFEEPVSVDYRTKDGTAKRGLDYVARMGTIVFQPGTASKTLRIRLTGDDIDEGDETFSLVLSNPVNAQLGTFPTAAATITDVAHPLVLTLSGARSYVEPDGRDRLPISINLSLNRPAPAGVRYELTWIDGSAVAYQDYNPSPGSRLFNFGRENDSVRMVIRGDDIPEGTETFSVTVTVDGAAVANDTITITILDND